MNYANPEHAEVYLEEIIFKDEQIRRRGDPPQCALELPDWMSVVPPQAILGFKPRRIHRERRLRGPQQKTA